VTIRSHAEAPPASTFARAALALTVVTALALALPERASAQASADAGVGGAAATGASSTSGVPVDPDALTPPKLLAFVEAGYPEQAREQKRDAEVLLKITIGEDGFVEDVALAGEPVGSGFDVLATSAARRFVFEPAARGGVPMRARVQYLYEFKYQDPAAVKGSDVHEAPSAAPNREARLTLTLRNVEDDKPLPDVEIMVTSPTDTAFAKRLLSDKDGLAHAEGLPPGSYDLALELDGYNEETHREELPAGETTDLLYRLHPSTSYEEYGAVAVIKAPAREVTRRTIEREVLTRVAGTRGDALRAIELLPGVARPPFTSGIVLIRGGGPNDSQVFLDGVPVPLLYHFGGLTSFINSRALDRIDFYPGNFSARYGRVTAGIIDVAVRDPQPDGYHGVVDLNLPLDSSLLLEGPLTDKASFMVAGRRSYFGEIIKGVIPADSVGAFAAPVYYDYQGFVTYRPTDRDRLRIGTYGSSDRLDILFAKNDDDPSIKAAEVKTQFHRGQLGWKHQYAPNTEHDIQFSVGRERSIVKFPPAFNLNLEFTRFYLRGELRHRISRSVQMIAGTDNDISLANAYYYGPTPPDDANSGNGGGDFAALPNQLYDKRATSAALSGYLEMALTPTRKLRIVPGLRLDYFSLLARFGFDPRISASYAITDKTKLRAGVGVFSQPAQPPYSLPGIGSDQLLFTKAIHYGVGVDHGFTKEFTLAVDGFYKSIYDRVVGTDFAAARARGQLNPAPFDNDGIGRVYGLEIAARKLASGRWFGFLSYTLMRSQLKDHREAWRASNYDQRHILSLAGNVRLPRNWELGGVLRIVGGNPSTPIAGASFDQDTGGYTPENGRFNSTRQPTFNRIDVRAEKSYVFKSWRMAVYLDIQNAYNRRNPETVTYNFNYKESAVVRGLPIIPVLGVRGTL
jgi:TonB family protein